jgi:ERCC4-type nuclease
LREICGFRECTSLSRIEILSSVETIGTFDFFGCSSLNDIVFSSDSHLRVIDEFCECTSLCRIEIPSSVEVVSENGFREYTSLNEIVFSSDSHLGEISGFGTRRAPQLRRCPGRPLGP